MLRSCFIVGLFAVVSPTVASACEEPARPTCMEAYQYRSARGDVKACALKMLDYTEKLMLWAICLDTQLGVAKRMIEDVGAQSDCLLAERAVCKLPYRLWTAPEETSQ